MPTQIATPLELRVAAAINAERTAAGLPEVKVETHLNASAQAQSDWMGEIGEITHVGENGADLGDRVEEAGFPLVASAKATENVASITLTGGLGADEVDRMHAELMDSPGHRANILDPEVSYVGIGLALGDMTVDGDERAAAFLTEDFGATPGQVQVQEEVDGQTFLQPFENGEPVGDPQAAPASEDPDRSDDDAEDSPDPVAASAGGCFVATAAYGSWTHPDVAALRRYRDEVLVRHAPGRGFIRAYRAFGPKLARLVSPRGVSGRAARAMISPLARLARRRTDSTTRYP